MVARNMFLDVTTNAVPTGIRVSDIEEIRDRVGGCMIYVRSGRMIPVDKLTRNEVFRIIARTIEQLEDRGNVR